MTNPKSQPLTAREQCEECNGNGRVLEGYDTLSLVHGAGAGSYTAWVTCDACDGTGQINEVMHEFKVRLWEYGLAVRHGQGSKAKVLADVLASMLEMALSNATGAPSHD